MVNNDDLKIVCVFEKVVVNHTVVKHKKNICLVHNFFEPSGVKHFFFENIYLVTLDLSTYKYIEKTPKPM